jgi:hypothetical protein
MAERNYTTRRLAIVDAIVSKLKDIDGTNQYRTNLFQNVSPRLKFWDEVEEFPAVHLNAGSETREYQAGGYKDRFLSVTVRCYVNEEDAVEALEGLLEDVETVLEENSRLAYTDTKGAAQYTQQITIVSIDTDEGVLEPYGVAEMQLEVRY